MEKVGKMRRQTINAEVMQEFRRLCILYGLKCGTRPGNYYIDYTYRLGGYCVVYYDTVTRVQKHALPPEPRLPKAEFYDRLPALIKSIAQG
jgi:hypothetical protein